MTIEDIPKIIDILIAVDGETMSNTLAPGTADKPTAVPDPLIFMIVKNDEAVFGQASKELKIKAATEDVIRWRGTSLSLNSNYEVLLYKYLVLRGEALLSPPTPLIVEVTTPLPNPSAPTKPKSQTRKHHFWQATVLSPGEVTYAFYMMILDRNSTVLGYYYWDPFISISV